ncbi:MAG: electron transport complex subunit RsxC [Clostridia bacterium]|nr:electron transport complex subunit RsxC [Clostridia bacterium]
MELRTFKGGIHPPHSKSFTEAKPVEKAEEPKIVNIPLQQHIGAPCQPVVEVGDNVKVGQVIGNTEAFVSAPIHSSVSGEVKGIKQMLTPTGQAVCITIESDGKGEIHESVQPKPDIETLSKEEIIKVIREAGITGMGGASFPTHVKLSPPPDKEIDTVILNGAECEPYLTADDRLMLENPGQVVYGLKAIMKAVEVKQGYIGIESNKPDAIKSMQEAVKDEPGIEVVPLQVKYPQGAEKQLIYACTKREVPSGKLPMEVKVVVNNVGTAAAIGEAFQTGMPLVERITSVTGSAVKEQKNLRIKIGTSFKEIIEQCGGYNGEVGKLIMGGPMMGLAQFTDEIPCVKGTSGILVLSEEDARLPEPVNCIRCAKCVSICPIGLMPVYLSAYALKDMYENAEQINALDCIECGSCSFVCPSKRPLLETIRAAKSEINARKRKQQQK